MHAPVGLRAVLREWTPLPAAAADCVSLLAGLLILLAGADAVFALHGARP